MTTARLHQAHSFSTVWMELLDDLHHHGREVVPRGQKTREIINVTLEVTDPYYNLLMQKDRNLNYRFAVAEWLWIWFGHDDVATIKQYNSNIASFGSDDGITFAGAYGPRVKAQWDQTITMLRKDRDSRQALIVIHERQTKPSKDVPCTLTCQFFIRKVDDVDKLLTVVNMRSSDVWLGLPYDFFNFSMLANIAAAELELTLGPMFYNLGSSHLYERNFEGATKVLSLVHGHRTIRSPQLPGRPPDWLHQALTNASTGQSARSWIPHPIWDMYGAALGSKTSREAREALA